MRCVTAFGGHLGSHHDSNASNNGYKVMTGGRRRIRHYIYCLCHRMMPNYRCVRNNPDSDRDNKVVESMQANQPTRAGELEAGSSGGGSASTGGHNGHRAVREGQPGSGSSSHNEPHSDCDCRQH